MVPDRHGRFDRAIHFFVNPAKNDVDALDLQNIFNPGKIVPAA